jgi:hypothetical protein
MLLNVVVLQVLRWWAHSVEVECLWNQGVARKEKNRKRKTTQG